MSNQEELSVTIFNFIKASPSYEADKDSFLILLRKFASLPPAPVAAAVDGSLLAKLKSTTLAERTLELVQLSDNPALRYAVDWASLDAQAVVFLENNVFQRVAMALRSLVTDDIAKRALKKISTISAKNVAGGEGRAEVVGDTLRVTGTFAQLSSCPSDGQVCRELDEKLGITMERMRCRALSEQLPIREGEISRELGSEVRLRVKESTFRTAAAWEYLDNVGALRLMMALRSMIADQTAKKLVSEALKSVLFANVETEAECAVQFLPNIGEMILATQFDRTRATADSSLLSYAAIYEELMRHLDVRFAQKKKELSEKQLPERNAELRALLGNSTFFFSLDYSSFSQADQLNFVDNVSCSRVAMAIRCLSGEAKDRVFSSLSSVRLANVSCEADKSISYKDGVLEMKCSYSHGLSGAFSDSEIRQVLSK